MHDVFAEGISLAPPANGHGNGNGHGTNGHNGNGNGNGHNGNGHNGHGEVEGGERAAVGSGRAGDQPEDEA